MAIEPVADPATPVAREIFANRQRLDVADAAPIEIARCRMMDRMAAPPVIVRGHRHDADCPTDPLVCGFARQERAVAAIVLDHEEANKQPGRRRRHGERNPDMAIMCGDQHRGPERDERQDGDRKLEEAPRRTRPAVGSEHLRPVARGLRCMTHFHRRHSRLAISSFAYAFDHSHLDTARLKNQVSEITHAE